jgi:hypothetical protein
MQRTETHSTNAQTANGTDTSPEQAVTGRGSPMQSEKTSSGLAPNPSLRVEATRALDALRTDQVGLALNILRRMSVSPQERLARRMGQKPPSVLAYEDALFSGKRPLARTQQVHGVLLDLLDGIGAEDMFLLVQLVCRMRKTAGIALDSIMGEGTAIFHPPDDSERPDASMGVTATNSDAAVQPSPAEHDDEPIPDTLRQFSTLSSRVELDNTLDGLDGDEIAVLASIAKRIEMGRKVYGPLQIATDPRAFRSKEARQELEDTLFYLTVAWLKATAQEVAR